MSKTTKEFKFSNGDPVTEVITGFKGIITGTCFYITGCNQYLVIPESKDNKKADGTWYDEERLKLTPKAKSIKLDRDETEKGKKRKPGCDIQAPNRG